ncbi:hypothetical protein GLOTRDRAFT_109274 [Gloeophyllum trabeum ATCC 11539]|uniref:Uncharacterized protein n=1 Tax=Gloeophyllum trabeum (strain ATCC 11539 / FP-39264 / Madison 617) TaxID=670483 RepID=S7QP11_GLOTA|nr:uncharacterized protein GLOTRDRAFT_109274 [Gloeophyllum trabeum ATCC 11539]EPQ61042.1 hypothetical protein GLOTRDRAFT_109274 [Gloeophyllum trabeum ATCC 11539]
MQSPRPILKRNAVTYPLDTSAATLASGTKHPSPRSALTSTLSVHFPPSHGLTKTFDTHSAAAYDRSPIVVSRNACALPERGCPGRTYGLNDDEEMDARGRTRHAKDDRRARRSRPLAAEGYTSSSPPGVLPPLIPDQSESDDSDSSSSSGHAPFRVSPAASSIPMSIPTKSPTYGFYSSPPGLSFLPHPHHEQRECERPRGRSRTRPHGDVSAKEQNHSRRQPTYKSFSHDNVLVGDEGCLGGF